MDQEKKSYSEGITFTTTVDETDATIIISGFSPERRCLPSADNVCATKRCYDMVARIWSTLRDTIKQRWHNDSVICVYYDAFRKTITCKFILNTGMLEDSIIGFETYKGLFRDTFLDQATMFEDAIIKFLNSESGYRKFLNYIEEHPDATDKELDGIIDAFLIEEGYVKPKKPVKKTTKKK